MEQNVLEMKGPPNIGIEQTNGGPQLTTPFAGGKGYPVTARQMTAKEERRFKQWKKK